MRSDESVTEASDGANCGHFVVAMTTLQPQLQPASHPIPLEKKKVFKVKLKTGEERGGSWGRGVEGGGGTDGLYVVVKRGDNNSRSGEWDLSLTTFPLQPDNSPEPLVSLPLSSLAAAEPEVFPKEAISSWISAQPRFNREAFGHNCRHIGRVCSANETGSSPYRRDQEKQIADGKTRRNETQKLPDPRGSEKSGSTRPRDRSKGRRIAQIKFWKNSRRLIGWLTGYSISCRSLCVHNWYVQWRPPSLAPSTPSLPPTSPTSPLPRLPPFWQSAREKNQRTICSQRDQRWSIWTKCEERKRRRRRRRRRRRNYAQIEALSTSAWHHDTADTVCDLTLKTRRRCVQAAAKI